MKKLAFLPLIPFLAAAVVGCSNNESAPAAGGGKTASTPPTDVKIGYVVKSATEPWFQQEWRFADDAAKQYHFTLVKLPGVDGEKVMSDLDNLGAQGCQGVIICTPDTKLGPAIVKKAADLKLKLFAVDDRLVDANGQPLTDVPFLGISAHKIGNLVGQAISDEMKARKWDPKDVYALELTIDELQTAMERIDGAEEIVLNNGLAKDHVYKSPWKDPHDIASAIDAANITLTQHPEVKKWVIYSSNDDGVLGAVRAMETHNIPAESVIGVGINGTSGVDDFKKPKMTGFFASVLLSPKKHGFGTAETVYKWIAQNQEPPKETYTDGILITRADYKEKMAKEGL